VLLSLQDSSYLDLKDSRVLTMTPASPTAISVPFGCTDKIPGQLAEAQGDKTSNSGVSRTALCFQYQAAAQQALT
jgi:hypothetical protein